MVGDKRQRGQQSAQSFGAGDCDWKSFQVLA